MRFQLNMKKSGKYAFFDPESRLHVTLSHPIGTSDRVTSGIRRALDNKIIIALDKVITDGRPAPAPQTPLEELKKETQEEIKQATEEKVEPTEEEVKEEVVTEEKEVKADDSAAAVEKPKKRGRKAKTPEAEADK